MRATTVIGISAGVHGVLFAGLARMAVSRTVAPAQHVQTTVSIETRAADPIEVVVLDEPAATPASTAASAMPIQRREAGSRRSVGADSAQHVETMSAASGTELPAAPEPHESTEPNTGSNTGSGLMHMRSAPVLALGDETAAKIPGRPYVAPEEPKISGKLEKVPGGRAVINDRVATFDIARDGTVKITDKPDIDLHWHLPFALPSVDIDEMRKDVAEDLTEWLKDPEAGKKFGRKADVSRVWMAVEGACDNYDDMWCDDELAPRTQKADREQKRSEGSILGGTADLTAYAMRKLGIGDPYAARKRKLLEDTEDERVAMGQRFRNEQLAKSSELVEKTLEWMWAREVDPAKRRQALFELWDDCEEGEGPRGAAGQRARAMILGWIGAHMPKGSPGAYSDEEIRRLDAHRTSKQSFTPY